LAGKPLALSQIDGLTMNKLSIALAIAGPLLAAAILLADYWILVRARQAALEGALASRNPEIVAGAL
jgi:hypothetical protein